MDPKITEIRVRYADTDQMSVAYYANYLVWMEVGRTEYLRNLGIPYRDMERDDDIILPVKEAFVDYKSSARYDDVVAVKSYIAELGRASVKIGYELSNKDDGRLLATGYTLHPFVNRAGKIIRIPEKIRAVLEKECL
ncbi:MAG: acyl-CoA thioesterase [Spirochaetes bacterium]|nr:acyl-CoA thioesterase [Spirochaetota bacterium]